MPRPHSRDNDVVARKVLSHLEALIGHATPENQPAEHVLAAWFQVYERLTGPSATEEMERRFRALEEKVSILENVATQRGDLTYAREVPHAS